MGEHEHQRFLMGILKISAFRRKPRVDYFFQQEQCSPGERGQPMAAEGRAGRSSSPAPTPPHTCCAPRSQRQRLPCPASEGCVRTQWMCLPEPGRLGGRGLPGTQGVVCEAGLHPSPTPPLGFLQVLRAQLSSAPSPSSRTLSCRGPHGAAPREAQRRKESLNTYSQDTHGNGPQKGAFSWESWDTVSAAIRGVASVQPRDHQPGLPPSRPARNALHLAPGHLPGSEAEASDTLGLPADSPTSPEGTSLLHTEFTKSLGREPVR